MHLFCETKNEATDKGFYYFIVHAKYKYKKTKVKIKMEEDILNDFEEKFKIIEVPNRKRQKKKQFNFLIFSNSKIILISFNSKKVTLNFAKLINRNVETEAGIIYCDQRKFFFVPNQNQLEIWDRTFTHEIYAIETVNTIFSYRTIPNSDLVILYDKYR